MPDEPPPAESAPVVAASTCRHLRSKGMYVYTDGQAFDSHDDYDTTLCWCLKTMKDFGPDASEVGVHECRDPARSCYEPT